METLLKQTDSIIRAMEYTAKYNPEILEYMKATNPRVVTFYNNTGIINVPIVDIKTKERGVAPMLYMDIARPSWRDNLLDILSDYNSDTLTVIPNGTPERTLDVTNDKCLYRLKRFGRYYKNSNMDMCLFQGSPLDVVSFMIENIKRFAQRKGADPIYNKDILLDYVEDSAKFDHYFHYIEDRNTGEQGIIELAMDKKHGVIHWVNTYRGTETENTRFGNNCLYHLITQCIGNRGYHTLNLGIDTFDYKTLWTQKQTFAKGFDYKE